MLDYSFAAYCLAFSSVSMMLVTGMNVWTGLEMSRVLRELEQNQSLLRNSGQALYYEVNQ